MKKTEIHQILVVDFINKKLISSRSFEVKVKVPKPKYDFTNFNSVPKDSNFHSFSDQDRMEYSEHVIKHIKEASFADLVHWANMGMVDMEKVSNALGIDITRKRKRTKKTPG